MRDRLRDLQRIAQSLMSRGGPLDRSPVAEQRAALEALQLLGSLAETTQSSLPAAALKTPLPAASPAPAVSAPAATANPAPATKPPYDSRKQEYRPALKDQELVGALLEYYQRSRPYRGPSRNLIKADQVGRSETFESPSIPHVDVRPKDGLVPGRATEVATHPILRPATDPFGEEP